MWMGMGPGDASEKSPVPLGSLFNMHLYLNNHLLCSKPEAYRPRLAFGGVAFGRCFSLLELIVVMALVATVLGVTMPSLRNFFRSRETANSARQIVVLSRFARERAMAEGQVYLLNFDLDAGRFWVSHRDMSDNDSWFNPQLAEGPGLRLPEGVRGYFEEPRGVEGKGWIPFYPDGRTEVVSLRLVGRRGETWRVVCPTPGEDFRVVGDD